MNEVTQQMIIFVGLMIFLAIVNAPWELMIAVFFLMISIPLIDKFIQWSFYAILETLKKTSKEG